MHHSAACILILSELLSPVPDADPPDARFMFTDQRILMVTFRNITECPAEPRSDVTATVPLFCMMHHHHHHA